MYHITWWAYHLGVRPFVGCAVYGREHIPSTGPFILASEHISELDVLHISTCLPACRTVHWMAARELYQYTKTFRLYQPKFGWARSIPLALASTFLTRHTRTIPVDRHNRVAKVNACAMNAAQDILARGGIVGIFPHGGIDRKDIHGGFVSLARRAQVPIVPVHRQKGVIAFGHPEIVSSHGPTQEIASELMTRTRALNIA